MPTVQANILDKVYLSTFIPLNDEAVWPGRLDAFLKPLPLVEGTNLPNRDEICGPGETAGCFAWDAGDSQLGWFDGTSTDPEYNPQGLLLQAPICFPDTCTAGDAAKIGDVCANNADCDSTLGGDGVCSSGGCDVTYFDDATLQVGVAEDNRRVYFGLPDSADEKSRRQIFQFPGVPSVTNLTLANYEEAFEIVPAGTATVDERRTAVSDIVVRTLVEKQAQVDNKCTAGDPLKFGDNCTSDADCNSATPGDPAGVCTQAKVQFVMGDIFHSNPLVLNPPGDFELFTKDLYWPDDPTDTAAGTGLCGDSAFDTAARGPEISYAWYSNKNLCRRVGLFVGSNDGQLHAFDAGIFRDNAAGFDCRLWFASTASDTDLSDQGDRHDQPHARRVRLRHRPRDLLVYPRLR